MYPRHSAAAYQMGQENWHDDERLTGFWLAVLYLGEATVKYQLSIGASSILYA